MILCAVSTSVAHEAAILGTRVGPRVGAGVGATAVVRFTALGDSTTVGIGDPLAGGGWRGWAAILAESLAPPAQVRFANLASVGARVHDVRTTQLPIALAERPHIASVIVGINDTLRSDFDVGRVRDDLDHAIGTLTGCGTTVLTALMHAHGRVFRLPSLLRSALWRRIERLNAVYEGVSKAHGALCVDLGEHPGTYDPASWYVDRLHPGELGHRLLARSFAEMLLQAGHDLRELPSLEPSGGVPRTRIHDAWWMVVKGVPWAVRRSRDLLPYAIDLTLRETAATFRGWTARRFVGEWSVGSRPCPDLTAEPPMPFDPSP